MISEKEFFSLIIDYTNNKFISKGDLREIKIRESMETWLYKGEGQTTLQNTAFHMDIKVK